jgi:hypothetical protein
MYSQEELPFKPVIASAAKQPISPFTAYSRMDRRVTSFLAMTVL